MAYYPLPKNTAEAVTELRKKQANRCHPGLLLDRFVAYADSKFITSYEQTDQKKHLDCVANAITGTGQDASLVDLNSGILKSEWDELAALVVDGHDGHAWRQKTIWRLAAHLSRATAVENASLCLHPIYGFPYLPATGLKGLAHAYAALEEADAEKKERLGAIFGSQSAAGTVLFLDAWPEAWPEVGPKVWPVVEVDILNNHHREYYTTGGQSGGEVSAPGDWENPVPVYFLAVAPDTVFRFCVAKLTEQTPADDVCLAAEWLQKGLQVLGAGAKTAAGYGYFSEPEPYDLPPPPDPTLSDMPEQLHAYFMELQGWLGADDAPDLEQQGHFLNLLENIQDTELKRQAVTGTLEKIAGYPNLINRSNLTNRRRRKQEKPCFKERLEEILEELGG